MSTSKSAREVKALTPNVNDVQDEQGQFLSFMLRGEMYAIGITHSKEILEYGQLTTVPMMPSYIRGVINLRGAVVPVVDLGSRFGIKQSDITKRTCIIIVEVETDEGQLDIGVVVDSVSEVLEIFSRDIEPAPSFGARIRTDFISGMGRVNDKFIVILDVGRVLSVEELAVIGDIGRG